MPFPSLSDQKVTPPPLVVMDLFADKEILSVALIVTLAAATAVVLMFPLIKILPEAVKATEPVVVSPWLLTFKERAFEKLKLPI